MKTRSTQAGNARFNRAVFYLVPLAAFLMMSARPGSTFLSMRCGSCRCRSGWRRTC